MFSNANCSVIENLVSFLTGERGSIPEPVTVSHQSERMTIRNNTPSWRRTDTIWVSLVIVAAALMRFINLNYMEFKGDEANNLFTACQIFQHRLPLVGIPSSIGTDNPPFFIYLMALPLSLSRNPVIAAGFIALLNCCAVGLTYIFCHRFFNRRIAVVASLLFAVNPWAIFYSRKIWQQDVLPIAVVGFFFFLFAAVFEKRAKALVGAFACYAMMTQLHLSSMFYGIVMLALVVWQRPKIKWQYYALGIATVLAIYLPYIIFDITEHGRNLHLYLHPVSPSSVSPIKPEALIWPFTLGTTHNFFHYTDVPLLDILLALLIISGALYTIAPWRDPKFFACGLWIFVPMLCLMFSKVDLVPHYFIGLYPIQFILIAFVIDAVSRWLESRAKSIALLPLFVVIALVVYEIQSDVRFLATIKEDRNVVWMEYGPPYQYRHAEVEDILRGGVTDPQQVHFTLLQSKGGQAFKYDFPATRYLVENGDSNRNR